MIRGEAARPQPLWHCVTTDSVLALSRANVLLNTPTLSKPQTMKRPYYSLSYGRRAGSV